MSYIIIARNPSNGGLVTMHTEEDEIMQFESEDDAEIAANGHPLFDAWGYQVVEAY